MTRKLVLGALAVLPLAACDDSSTSADNALVKIEITDALADYVQNVDVWISRVYLQGGPGHAADTADASTGGRVDLFNQPSNPYHVDLLTLQSGGVGDLTDSVSVEAGAYKQLRIVVDSAKITLKAGLTFEGGSNVARIKIPSGSTSGVKVLLSGPVDAAEGEATILLADFDLNQSLVMQPSGQGPNIFRAPSMSPVIKEKGRKQD